MLKSQKTGISVHRGLTLVLSFCAVLLAGQASAYAQAPVLTEQTESFLGDRSSVGALVGGILAGAAFATPLAPLGGTIVGFFVGKSTDYSKDDTAAGYQHRSFAPASEEEFDGLQLALSDPSGTGAPTLALATAEESSDTADEAPTPVEPASVSDDESNATTVVPVPEEKSGSSEISAAKQSEPKKVAPKPINLVITKEVGRTQDVLDAYAKVIREEQSIEPFEPHPQCPTSEAPKYRKKLAVAGFALEHPEQSVFGGLKDVENAVSTSLYQKFEQSERVQTFSAPQWQMFASNSVAPTMTFGSSNKLGKYSAISREMGVQFVMSGVIRDVGIHDPGAWDTDYGSKVKRAFFSSDTTRNFEVDMIVHDGYTGRVIMEKRYSSSGRWDVPRNKRIHFGSSQFFETAYGEAVDDVLVDMTAEVLAQLDCQPMLVPITEVTGKDLLLEVGTSSGLLPGAIMRLVRAEGSLARPDEPAQLWDTDVELHIHSLSLDSARAWMPMLGSHINIQKGDYAVIY